MAKKDEREVRYEPHALRRMEQRGITKAQVEQTVAHPHRQEAAQQYRRRVERDFFSGNLKTTVVLIVEDDTHFVRIISVWKN